MVDSVRYPHTAPYSAIPMFVRQYGSLIEISYVDALLNDEIIKWYKIKTVPVYIYIKFEEQEGKGNPLHYNRI